MFNPLSKMNVSTLCLDADLLEAAKKIKENDAYNPSGSGPARLPSEPSSGGKMNVTDDKKHGKGCNCNECSMTPGYVKTNRTYEEKKYCTITSLLDP